MGDLLAFYGLGLLQAHPDFGIAAGYVNSGQRVYHGRGNSTAFLGRVKTNLSIGALPRSVAGAEVLQAFDLTVKQAGKF
jgi:hypothetical protein